MAANQDVYDFLRSTEENLKTLRQRASSGAQADASLIAGSREAIAGSLELLREPIELEPEERR